MRILLLVAAAVALGACSSAPVRQPPAPAETPATEPPAAAPLPPGTSLDPNRKPTEAELAAVPDAVPRAEARSLRGNPPFYTVLGKRYSVLPTAEGFRERGVASWYGPTFHAKDT